MTRINSIVLVFDFDGTVLPTTLEGYRKVQEMMRQIGLPPASDDFIRLHWGKKFPDIAKAVCRHAGGDDGHIEAFLQLDKEYVPQYQLNQEVIDTISILQSSGIPTALLTSRDIGSLLRVSKIVGFNLSIFNYRQTLEDAPYPKPDPRVFNPLIDWINTLPGKSKKMIYFGDTVQYDYLAVKQSGLPINFVGVVSGVSSGSDFVRAGVNDIVYGVQNLPGFLKNLFSFLPAFQKEIE
jgi:phosphoglycolate phosphatase-like HAD superfamily hydrolase